MVRFDHRGVTVLLGERFHYEHHGVPNAFEHSFLAMYDLRARSGVSHGRIPKYCSRFGHSIRSPDYFTYDFARFRRGLIITIGCSRFCAPANGSRIAFPVFSIAPHSFVDLLAIAPIFR
jgi:hypothetical protein